MLIQVLKNVISRWLSLRSSISFYSFPIDHVHAMTAVHAMTGDARVSVYCCYLIASAQF